MQVPLIAAPPGPARNVISPATSVVSTNRRAGGIAGGPKGYCPTSAGLRNQTLRQAPCDLLAKPFASANVVYVPTASLAGYLGFRWYSFPMEAVIDQAGRIVLPKAIRDALGLLPGTKVDISPYGAGVQLVPAGRTARLIQEDGVLVSAGETPVDDEMLFALIDAGRR
jgi:AbrB family looped-hinge helix DNA binding protein